MKSEKEQFFLKKNRSGDISVTILVIGIIAVCALALFSFFSSSFKLEKAFTELPAMEEINVKINEYNFYKSINIDDEQIKVALDIRENFQGKYIYAEQNSLQVTYNLGK